jgi:hypothetical protein
MTKRTRSLKRLKQVEAALAICEKDGAIIKKHCSATPEKIQAAIRAYQKRYRDADALVLGLEFLGQKQLKGSQSLIAAGTGSGALAPLLRKHSLHRA